jgi:tRNA U34 5-methylaminomethyl-2-thiouridine-forming methyltransferase MnmC
MEMVNTSDGSPTLFSKRYGECFHSKSGAVLESRERFAVACKIKELAALGSVNILDIGFGLGYNVCAALETAGGIYTKVKFSCTSFEKDPDVLEFVKTFKGPAEFETIYPAMRVLAKFGRYTSGGIFIEVKRGLAEELILDLPREATFDAVFLDPFSPSVNPELWTGGFFREIAARVKPYAILSTYSSAIVIKENLVKAGFKIGKGAKVGDKGSGTLASLCADLPQFPEREIKKLERRIERSEKNEPPDKADPNIAPWC